ncbi:MAG: branched-chain amino acid ABC transporter permease [Spirochaetales bacterium]|nr:branched-chain amino acid ABC transporter permease [Spirochaetales bacterium]
MNEATSGRKTLPRLLLAAGVLAVLVLVPLFIRDPYLLDIAITVLLFAYLGNAWNIMGGYCGQASLGHAAYYGIGAYASTVLMVKLGLSPWLGMFAGVILSAGLSMVLGYPSLRMRGPYFVFFTIGFAEALRILFLTWDWIEGASGLIIPFQANPARFMFSGKTPYYYIILAMLVLGMLLTFLIERARIGRYFVAIREDETMAEALGIHTSLYKTMALAISAALMALGGTFYAQYVLFIHPDNLMSLENSVIFMLIVIVGGRGTLYGPLIGAAILMPLWEYFRATFGGRLAGLGVIFAGAVILIIGTTAPNGFLGVLGRIRERTRARKVQGRQEG